MPVINDFKYTRIYVDHEITIKVADHVLRIWHKNKQQGLWMTEAFGVLVGAYDAERHIVFITDCTQNTDKDFSEKYSFKMIDEIHAQKVIDVFHRTKGYQNYLGTWHTHPERRPRPSEVDKKDWVRAVKNNKKIPQFVFVIVGTEEIGFFPKKQSEGIKV